MRVCICIYVRFGVSLVRARVKCVCVKCLCSVFLCVNCGCVGMCVCACMSVCVLSV